MPLEDFTFDHWDGDMCQGQRGHLTKILFISVLCLEQSASVLLKLDRTIACALLIIPVDFLVRGFTFDGTEVIC